MTFTGKQLHTLGCPPNKIKFFIGVEFVDEQDAVDKFNERNKEEHKPDGNILQWIWDTFPHLPMQNKGDMPVPMSKGALRRIMTQGGLVLNGRKPKHDENFAEGDFPIASLVWFPNSPSKTTWA